MYSKNVALAIPESIHPKQIMTLCQCIAGQQVDLECVRASFKPAPLARCLTKHFAIKSGKFETIHSSIILNIL